MRSIQIRGNKVCYEDLNQQNEDIVLLVHGYPFNHTMWKYQDDALQNFRMIIPDLKGYGESDYDFEKNHCRGQRLFL